MSYNIVQSLVDGEVIDQHDAVDGINPAVTIAVDAVYDTGLTDFTGYATFVSGNESCIVFFYKEGGSLKASTTIIGSANFNTNKDEGSKINVYVESGELKIQNKTTEDISLSVRF